jgi:geranylgeranyl diphosphate synthase type II
MTIDEYTNKHKDRVLATLLHYIPSKQPHQHYDIVRDYPKRKSSYRRPILLLLAGQMFGASFDQLRLPAAIYKLLEDWLLLEDDVIDQSDVRRGLPTIHRLHGNGTAVNAGDATSIVAWRMANDYIGSIPQRAGERFFDVVYDVLDNTFAGQFLDSAFFSKPDSLENYGEDDYIEIAKKKTSFHAVCGPLYLGAVVAGAQDKDIGVFRTIGIPAGIAYQMSNDLSGLVVAAKKDPKLYDDLYQPRLTIPLLYAYRKSRQQVRKTMDAVLNRPRCEKTTADITFMVRVLERTNALEYARRLLRCYIARTQSLINRYQNDLPDNQYRAVLLKAIVDIPL